MVSQSDIAYRLRGIPDHYGKDEVSQLVARLLELDVGAISVRSLASHHFRKMEKVATLNLWERPRKLGNGANEWEFQCRDALQGGDLDIVIDTNFIGITPLHGTSDEGYDTCCIALSGLNAHAFGSFKARSDNFMWLRDALPMDLPNSRIYIYGHDTSMVDSLSRQTILDLGLHFAENLKGLVGRWSSTFPKSLLLIGHSLGGLVLEQALVNFAKHDRENMEIIRALKGILLFGVPHLGMFNRPLLPMVQGQPNEGLVSCLKVDSDFLELQQEDFATARLKMRNAQVIAFYETVDTPTVEKDRMTQQWKMIGSPALLVSKSSATKGCDVTIPINRNHSEIVKFSRQHNDYFVVVTRLRELKKSYQQKQATEYSRLSDDEKNALRSLGFSEQHWRRDELNPTNDTCGWILLNSTFNTWLDPQAQKENVLWIAGNPGTGKSTMMKYVHNVIQQQWHADYVLFSYFFHGRGTTLQKTKLGFLRSILHQFLRRFQDSLKIFMSEYNEKSTQDKNIQWTEVELERILMKVIRELYLEENVKICLLVDALDESGEKPAQDIVSLLDGMNTNCTEIKIVFSCRWYPILQRTCNHIVMEDENQTDIQTVVNSLLVKEFRSYEEITILKESIIQRARGMFQWALLVTRSVVDKHRKLGKPISALQQIIKELPSDLHELYASLLQDFEVNGKLQTIKLLRWILFSIRPLTAEELQHALVADEKHIPGSIGDFESNDHFVDPMKGIITLSRGLAEIKLHGRKKIAQFIHQSVPDYLLIGGGLGRLIGSTTQRSVVGESHFAISRSCLKYALLPEILEFASANIDHKYRKKTIDNAAKRFPLARYVHDYWVVHIMHVESYSIDQKDLLELLKNREKVMCPSGVLTIPPYRSFYGSTDKNMSMVFKEDSARFKGVWGVDANEQQEECRKFPLGFKKSPWKAWECMDHHFNGGDRTDYHLDVGRDWYSAWEDHQAFANIVVLFSLAGIRSALKSIGRQAFARIQKDRRGELATKTRKSPLLLSLMENPDMRLEDIPENLTTEEVNVDPSERNTPVYLAVLLGREKLVQRFIKAGAELNRLCGGRNRSPQTVLWVAIFYKNKKIARILRDAGAELDAKTEPEQVEHGLNMASYKILFAAGVTAKELFAPLIHDSFDPGKWGFLLKLLKAGLDPNGVIKDDLTVFQAALRSDHVDLIVDFVECPRTKPDMADTQGRTPLMRRVMWNSTKSLYDLQWTIDYCVDTGRFDLEVRDNFGETLLAHATRETNDLIVETLLSLGAQPNVPDVNGRTPLMVAAEHGQEQNLQALLASDKTDVNLSDNQQWTALCYATVNRKKDCANILLMSSRIDVEDSRRRLASVWFDLVEQGDGGALRNLEHLRPQWFYREVVEQMRSKALRSGKTHIISALTDIGVIQ